MLTSQTTTRLPSRRDLRLNFLPKINVEGSMDSPTTPYSSCSSLQTIPPNMKRHQGILRHSDSSLSPENGDSDVTVGGNSDDGERKTSSVRFMKNDERHKYVTSSKSTSRNNRRMRRTIRDADIPLADVSTDKSTASQAVAFVIRASRRGVVSLCAEVADLLKDRNRLEQELEEKNKEIVILLENQAVPRSPEPPLPETCDFSMQSIQDMESQTYPQNNVAIQTETMSLVCTKRKARDENEPETPPDCSDITFINFECGSDFAVTCLCPKSVSSSSQNPGKTAVAINTGDGPRLHSKLGYFEHHNLEHKFKALEIKHEQLKMKLSEDTGHQMKTTDELNKAKEEIVVLQKAIQDIQTKEYERIQEEERLKQEENYSIEAQDDVSDGTGSDDSDDVTQRRRSLKGSREKSLLPIIANTTRLDSKQETFRSSIFPGPILGCKCQMCTAFFRSSGVLGFACSPYVTDSSGKNPVLRDLRKLVCLQNSKLQLQQNDQVMVRGSKTGIVRYIGHLDGVGTPSVVYIGLELNSAAGKHDGYLYGKRYFFCTQDHGIFLPIQDVLCVISKKSASGSSRKRIPKAILSKPVTLHLTPEKPRSIKPKSHQSNSRRTHSKRRSMTSSESDTGSSTSENSSSFPPVSPPR
ncbi:uncharacterized protein LOC104266347 isoform X2 [Ciona intestinalis]